MGFKLGTILCLSLSLSQNLLFPSGPVLLMILEKENAVADWRALIGPTNASKAKVTHPHRSQFLLVSYLYIVFPSFSFK